MGLLACITLFSGCMTLFGWKIHAPGILSNAFFQSVEVQKTRLALYIPEDLHTKISTDKGTFFSDPQVYAIGEAFVPMLIEAFNYSFSEFILFEIPPTSTLLHTYGIHQLAIVEITGFRNRKSLKGQGLDLHTQTTLLDKNMQPLYQFKTRGTSEAPDVFAKKGGPEVNLNASIESALQSIVQTIQDQQNV